MKLKSLANRKQSLLDARKRADCSHGDTRVYRNGEREPSTQNAAKCSTAVRHPGKVAPSCALSGDSTQQILHHLLFPVAEGGRFECRHDNDGPDDNDRAYDGRNKTCLRFPSRRREIEDPVEQNRY